MVEIYPRADGGFALPKGLGPGALRRGRLYDALFTAQRHRSRRVNKRHWARFLRRTRALALSYKGDSLAASWHVELVRDPECYPSGYWPHPDGLSMVMRQHELEHWTGRRLRFQAQVKP